MTTFTGYHLYGVSKANKTAYYDRSKDPHELTVFMKNSGWTWYQDPRAIIHNNKLVIGAVEGKGNGSAVIGVYDLEQNSIIGRTVVHKNYDHDDHNSPVFSALPDGKLLTVYARHGKEKFHQFRISESPDFITWGSEKTLHHHLANKNDKVTYMNLYNMKSERKLYNFFRGINYNPTFVTSTDNGQNWSKPTQFIQNETYERQRPYAKYTSNGIDIIHVNFTNAHPQKYGNSIYYAAFKGGRFYKADGTLIKDLKNDGPLRPSEAEKVFQGGSGKGRGHNLSAHKAASTCSIELDELEKPHISYTYYLSNTDLRYRMAFWDGKKWVDREVAYGGKCLYDQESSFTGLITLDPVDPTYVIISTDVNPSTGENTGGNHEIYRAKVGAEDDISTIFWEPITQNSPVRNIRPVILTHNNKRIITWLRGDYKTYTNYDLDTVGIIENR